MVGSLVFALAACGGGGGGGDEDAFCDSLDSLSGLVEDGDLADDGGLGDAVDIANDLRETASDDQSDAIQEVGEALSEANPDDAADTADLIQDELGDFADDCEIDEFAEAPEEETTTTTEPEEETTTTADPDDTTTTEGGEVPSGDVNVLGALQPVPGDIEAEFAALADQCFVGDMGACDLIFFGTDGAGAGAAPQGSVAREYSSSCAGRIATFVEGQPGECVNNFFLASPPDVGSFSDPSFEGLAQGCFANDMQSCVDLFLQTDVGTSEELYGQTCGFRVDATVTTLANCLDIFGPVAFG
jgi:hypothetical protein